MTKSEKEISEVKNVISTLDERVDNLVKKVDEVAQRSRETESLAHEIDKRLTTNEGKIERLEKSLDELRTKRWEIWKIILTAVLSSTLGLVVGRLLK